uniref:Uncharacterized protein n=1 Tax=Hyaloperonospora arabidopsidis (strain Emoy2) TaxID=559515 RepID=M4C397_HYAAE
MVNKSMWCTAKFAGSAAMRLRSSAADELKAWSAEGDKPPVASSTQSSAVAAEDSRGFAPRSIEDIELELIYSGESNSDTDTKKTSAKTDPVVATPEPSKSGSRSAMSLAERRDIFGSSEESDASYPSWSRSLESNRSGGKSQFNYDEAVMRHF